MTTAVSRGIDWLLRLDYPSGTSELELKRHSGKTNDALEMIDALEILRVLFSDTRRCISIDGKPTAIYRGEKQFDFIHDLKQAIEGQFFAGDDQKSSALLRRKNRSMVVLMLNPIVDLFLRSTHEEALEACDQVIDKAIDRIINCEHDATPDDAFVVQHLIAREVARRNKIQATVDGIMRLRRRKRRRKKK